MIGYAWGQTETASLLIDGEAVYLQAVGVILVSGGGLHAGQIRLLTCHRALATCSQAAGFGARRFGLGGRALAGLVSVARSCAS